MHAWWVSFSYPQTVNAGNAGSHHNRGWEPFTREILKTVAKKASGTSKAGGPLAAMFQGEAPKKGSGVVFLAWGLPAARTLAEAGITEVRRVHSPRKRPMC